MARARPKEQQMRNPRNNGEASKHFRYLDTPWGAIESPYLTRELRHCGKPSCRCQRGARHGPYTFLRYTVWDAVSGESRHRREYVPRGEVRRVRRWLRRYRAQRAYLWSMLRLMRRVAQRWG